jgi:RNA polymerase sigma-54 factor
MWRPVGTNFMALLQPRLNLKVSQKQVLTPGLVQMVSVLALNRLELREMINAEIVENPVLEELDETMPVQDDMARSDEPIPETTAPEAESKDSFEEIDLTSYFQEYLDPGYRTPASTEMVERPSFENFLSQPSTLTDHLMWQLGSLSLPPELRASAEMIVGNLDEDGYLTASEEELLDAITREPACLGHDARALLTQAIQWVQSLDPPGIAARDLRECLLAQIAMARRLSAAPAAGHFTGNGFGTPTSASNGAAHPGAGAIAASASATDSDFEGDALSAEDLSATAALQASTDASGLVLDDAQQIVEQHLGLLQKRDLRDLARVMRRPAEALAEAVNFIRTLDPRPGRRYYREEARLIEPDVAIMKRDDGFISVLNDDDLPVLRLNQGYRRLLTQDGTERDVRNYIKERYKSAIQLIRNIEQRKSTILRVCDVLIRRQYDFLEQGVEALHPMMIKDVAEEIGVHPSTVSRAVANKYVHTPQGVFELRFFFSEGANGPEGSGTPLMLVKRKVKKIIEDEDAGQPLTDDHIAKMLQDQGINVTRRTVAKYREDLHIPSTHQRRVRQ